METQARHRNLKEWFGRILDTPVSERSGLFARLGQEQPSLVPALRELVETEDSGSGFWNQFEHHIEAQAGAALLQAGKANPALFDLSLHDLPQYFQGRVLEEKYQLETILGQGGMGVVFQAEHLHTKRKVAVKIVLPQAATQPEFLQRFKLEAQASGKLLHPNIVNVTDFGFASLEGLVVPYLVMELLEGETLGQYLRQKGRLPLVEVLEIVEQIALGLDHAHQNGVLHRDLKPENIWLQPDQRGGFHVKLLDFGIAKLQTKEPQSPPVSQSLPLATQPGITRKTALNRTLSQPKSQTGVAKGSQPTAAAPETRAGDLLGTPAYMAPEQCRGCEIDSRADIYSLGIVTYQMVVGRTPFSGDVQKVLEQQQRANPLELPPRDFPPSVKACLGAALSKNPAARPATATAFSRLLRTTLETEASVFRMSLRLYQKNLPKYLGLSLLACFWPVLLCFCLFQAAIYLPGQLMGWGTSLCRAACLSLTLGAVGFALLWQERLFGHALAVQLEQGETWDVWLVRRKLAQGAGAFLRGLREISRNFNLRNWLTLQHWTECSFGAAFSHLEPQAIDLPADRLLTQGQLQARTLVLREAMVLALSLPLLFIAAVWAETHIQVNLYFDNWHESFRPPLLLYGFVPLWLLLATVVSLLSLTKAVFWFRLQCAANPLLATSQELLFRPDKLRSNELQTRIAPHIWVYLLVAISILASMLPGERYAFWWAAKHGNEGVARLLFLWSADPNASLPGWTCPPLHQAAFEGNLNMVQYLLQKGANPNLLADFFATGSSTPLVMAAASPLVPELPSNSVPKPLERLKIVIELLDHGADPNASNENGRTPVMFAAANGNLELVQYLIEHEANPHRVTKGGTTALMYAIDSGNLTLVKYLLSRNCSIKPSQSSVSPLFAATQSDEMMILLLDHGADPNGLGGVIEQNFEFPSYQDRLVTFPVLCWAVRIRSPKVIQLMLEKGADVRGISSDGETALIETAKRNQGKMADAVVIARMLLKAGIDPSVRDRTGKTALDYAVERGNSQLVKLLLEEAQTRN
ncbi:MAG: ankyrin repeat domain-containing protein [Blastocatellia bacterium]|nr:ankyrin repeat domain-containing protein [Blastocatellia bacterium]